MKNGDIISAEQAREFIFEEEGREVSAREGAGFFRVQEGRLEFRGSSNGSWKNICSRNSILHNNDTFIVFKGGEEEKPPYCDGALGAGYSWTGKNEPVKTLWEIVKDRNVYGLCEALEPMYQEWLRGKKS